MDILKIKIAEGFYLEIENGATLVGELESTQQMFVVEVDGRRAGIDKADIEPILAKLYGEGKDDR